MIRWVLDQFFETSHNKIQNKYNKIKIIYKNVARIPNMGGGIVSRDQRGNLQTHSLATDVFLRNIKVHIGIVSVFYKECELVPNKLRVRIIQVD